MEKIDKSLYFTQVPRSIDYRTPFSCVSIVKTVYCLYIGALEWKIFSNSVNEPIPPSSSKVNPEKPFSPCNRTRGCIKSRENLNATVMRKKKMNLKSLKVKSFVTSMEENKESTAKGGGPILTPIHTIEINCRSLFLHCPTELPRWCITMPSGCAGPCTGPPSLPPCGGFTVVFCAA